MGDIFDILKNHVKPHVLPPELSLATMTLILDVKPVCDFFLSNVGKYLQYNEYVKEIKFGSDDNAVRSQNPVKKKQKRKKLSNKSKKTNFYNQVSIKIKVGTKINHRKKDRVEDKLINVKLFQNGSLQLTGCNNFENARNAIKIVFDILNIPRYLFNMQTKTIQEVRFIKFTDKYKTKLSISDIVGGIVVLINCVFNINFAINRNKLHELIMKGRTEKDMQIHKYNVQSEINEDERTIQKYIDCTFDPIRHGCVSIKMDYFDKITTIFVFEAGKILIIANTCEQAKCAYNMISTFLLSNYFNLVVKK